MFCSCKTYTKCVLLIGLVYRCYVTEHGSAAGTLSYSCVTVQPAGQEPGCHPALGGGQCCSIACSSPLLRVQAAAWLSWDVVKRMWLKITPKGQLA